MPDPSPIFHMATILFVDDDSFTLKLMEKAATLLGHQPVLTASASAALEEVRTRKMDLIIADFNLPGLNGLAFLNALRESCTDCYPPVLILSASDYADDVQQALSAGASEYLTKPLSLDRLAQAIQQHVRQQ